MFIEHRVWYGILGFNVPLDTVYRAPCVNQLSCWS